MRHKCNFRQTCKTRQVHRLAALRADRQRVLQHRHHAQSEQVDLDDAHVLAIGLVPLQDGAPGHAGVLQRHEPVERPRAQHHAARVLPEVPRQAVDPPADVEQRRQPRMAGADARQLQLLGQLQRVRIVAAMEQAREPVQHVVRQAEHLAHLPHRVPALEGDDVRGHGRAPPAVAAVDLLDDLLAAVAARQIQVDVRPVGPPLGQEPLEEQLAPHRIDRGDAERVADRAVGGRAAALHQDAPLPRERAEIPDDEEIAREPQLRDQRQLALQLPPHVADDRAVALLRPEVGHLPQKRILRLARRHAVVREPVAEVRQRELQPGREFFGVGHRLRQIGEQRGHRRRRLEMPLVVARELASGGVERRVFAQAGEHIRDRARLRGRMEHAVGGKQRQARGPRPVDQEFVLRLLAGDEVALDFHVEAVRDRRCAVSLAPAAAAAAAPRSRQARRTGPSSSPVSATSPSECSASSGQLMALSPLGARRWAAVSSAHRPR